MQFMQACNNSSVLKIESLFNLFVSQSPSHCCKLWALLPLNVLLLINQSPSHCRAWWAVSKVLVSETLSDSLYHLLTLTSLSLSLIPALLSPHWLTLALSGSSAPKAMIPDSQIEELWMESLMTMSEFCLEREPLVVSEPLPKDCKPESRLWKAKPVVDFGNLLDI